MRDLTVPAVAEHAIYVLTVAACVLALIEQTAFITGFSAGMLGVMGLHGLATRREG